MQLTQVIPLPVLFLLETPLKILYLLIKQRPLLVELRLRLHLSPCDLLHPLLHFLLGLSHLLTTNTRSLPERPHFPVPLRGLPLACRPHLFELLAHDHVGRLDLSLLQTQLLEPVVTPLYGPSQLFFKLAELGLQAVFVVALQGTLKGQLAGQMGTYLVDQVQQEVGFVHG